MTTQSKMPVASILDTMEIPYTYMKKAGLGTAFFYVLNASFFCVLLTLIKGAFQPLPKKGHWRKK